MRLAPTGFSSILTRSGPCAQELGAQEPDGKKVPNITPDPEDGIGRWRAGDVTYYLKTGFRPDGDVAGGAMSGVIEDATAHLGDADRAAIAAYLWSLTPIPRQ